MTSRYISKKNISGIRLVEESTSMKYQGIFYAWRQDYPHQASKIQQYIICMPFIFYIRKTHIICYTKKCFFLNIKFLKMLYKFYYININKFIYLYMKSFILSTYKFISFETNFPENWFLKSLLSDIHIDWSLME